jgi:RNA polymerase sigma-70 factor (ECF subfamily)
MAAMPLPPRPPPTDDEPRHDAGGGGTGTLVARARSGDQAAVTELFERYLPKVRGLVAVRARRPLHGLADGEDLAQEALTAALLRLDRVEVSSEAGFVCWLGRLVDARLVDARRRELAAKRGGGRVRALSDVGTTTRERNAPRAPDASPSEALALGDEAARLEQRLLALGGRHRLVIYLRLVLDMPWHEVAAELRLANGESARSLFHKALARLRDSLRGGAGGGPH